MISLNESLLISLSRIPSALQVSLIVFASLTVWVLYYYAYRPLLSPLRDVQCAPGGEGCFGHLDDMHSYNKGPEIDQWVEKLGPTFRIRGCFYVNHRIFTLDPRAIQHILSHSNDYRKPVLVTRFLKRYLREGLISADGERHRVQRKVAQKLFSSGTLKAMTEIVKIKANQVRDVFQDLCSDPTFLHPAADRSNSAEKESNTRLINVYDVTSRSTYDIIGKIAIDHEFDCLTKPDGPGGQLFERYVAMQQYPKGNEASRTTLEVLFPCLVKLLPSRDYKRIEAALRPLDKVSKVKIEEKIREMQEGKRSDMRDLLTLQLRTNLAKDTPADMKLTEEEMLGQLATFMFAGTDTTAGTLAWCLYQLSRQPGIQDQLRAECLGFGEGLPYDQLDALPFLDAVVKETLRTNPQIPSTIRQAHRDDVIPLATPIVTRSGKTVSLIKIRKGQFVHLPIENLNMAASLWGPDSRSFSPTRWLNPQQPKEGPGVWPNIMTFIDGPRRCIGYKLAIIEMKIMIFTLVRAFVFAPMPDKRIYKWNMWLHLSSGVVREADLDYRSITRPYVEGELLTKGPSLPLLVKPYKG